MSNCLIELRCWAVCINGEHYTGDVYYSEQFEKTEIKQKMSSRMAIALNKKDGCRLHRGGDETGRFETELSAIKHGVKLARDMYPDIKYVGRGSYAAYEPKEIVWCVDDDVMKRANPLWKEYYSFYDNTNDPWPEHGDSMDEIDAEWRVIVDAL